MIWIATESTLEPWLPPEKTPSFGRDKGNHLFLLDHLHQKFFLFPALRAWPFSRLHQRYLEESTEGILSKKSSPHLWSGHHFLPLKHSPKMIQGVGLDSPTHIPLPLEIPDAVGCGTLTLVRILLSLLPKEFLESVGTGWTIASIHLPPFRPRLLLLHHGGIAFSQILTSDTPFETALEGFHQYAQRRCPKEKFLYVQWHKDSTILPEKVFWSEGVCLSEKLTPTLLHRFCVSFQKHPWSQHHRQEQAYRRLSQWRYGLLTLLCLMVPGFFWTQHLLQQKCLFWEGQKPPRPQWEMTAHRLLEKQCVDFFEKNKGHHRANTLRSLWLRLDTLFLEAPMTLSRLTFQSLPHGAIEISLEGVLEETSAQEVDFLQKKVADIFPRALIRDLRLPPSLDMSQDFEASHSQSQATDTTASPLTVRMEVPYP